MVVRVSICVTARLMAKSSFEIASLCVKSTGWAGGGGGTGVEVNEGPQSIIPNGWPVLNYKYNKGGLLFC